MEADLWIALLGQLQVDHRWRNVGQSVAAIQSQEIVSLTLELIQFTLIRGRYPACRCNIYRLIHRLNLIFALEPTNHHIKLQDTHRSHDQVVVSKRAKNLYRAFFRKLDQTLFAAAWT